MTIRRSPEVAAAIASAQFRAAVLRGDHRRALRIILELWRATRSTAVAARIAALDTKALADFGNPPNVAASMSVTAFDDAWTSVASRSPDPVVTGWLASTFALRLPVRSNSDYEPWSGDGASRRYVAMFRRVAALEALGPDPRIAAALTRFIAAAPVSFGHPRAGDAVYGPLIRSVVAQGDVRSAEALQALVDLPRARSPNVRDYLRRALPDAIAQLRSDAPAAAHDDPSWLAIVPAVEPVEPAVGEAELLAEVYADPDDQGARAVYADLLQTRGDPRGEFIALQMVRSEDLSPAIRLSLRNLWRMNKDVWVGDDLAAVLANVSFERGFLHSASLRRNSVADVKIWERAALDPRLATLAELHKGQGNAAHYRAFVTSSAATGLKSIEIPDWEALDAFTSREHGSALRHLDFHRPPRRGQWRAMAKAPALSGVHAVTVRLDSRALETMLAEFLAADFAPRVDRLYLRPRGNAGFGPGRAFALWKRLPSTVRTIGYREEDGIFELSRTADGLRALVEGASVRHARSAVRRFGEQRAQDVQLRVLGTDADTREQLQAAGSAHKNIEVSFGEEAWRPY